MRSFHKQIVQANVIFGIFSLVISSEIYGQECENYPLGEVKFIHTLECPVPDCLFRPALVDLLYKYENEHCPVFDLRERI